MLSDAPPHKGRRSNRYRSDRANTAVNEDGERRDACSRSHKGVAQDALEEEENSARTDLPVSGEMDRRAKRPGSVEVCVRCIQGHDQESQLMQSQSPRSSESSEAIECGR